MKKTTFDHLLSMYQTSVCVMVVSNNMMLCYKVTVCCTFIPYSMSVFVSQDINSSSPKKKDM